MGHANLSIMGGRCTGDQIHEHEPTPHQNSYSAGHALHCNRRIENFVTNLDSDFSELMKERTEGYLDLA